GDTNGLKAWPSAGSTSLTSDIDVNLKGTQTEYAVEVFNKLFKADGWNFESGVVYDVNVYAMDFMHKFGGVDVAEAGGKHTVTVKEGARRKAAKKQQAPALDPANAGGGAKEEESEFLVQGGFIENAFTRIDTSNQEEWALVKLRLYMSLNQWNQYKQNLIRTVSQPPASNEPDALKKAEAKRIQKLQLIQNAEAKYDQYLTEMNAEMETMVGEKLGELGDVEKSGIERINEKAETLAKNKKPNASKQSTEVFAEQLKIGGSNRIYERKLATIAKLRQEIQEMIGRYNEIVAQQGPIGNEVINGAIEIRLKKLRQLVSEAALYSNEAYITDAAVYHAVVGLQGGQQIEQNKADLMNAVTENMADSLKEIARHGHTIGEAGYKAAKYYMRMADAAKNMGCGHIEGVNTLYDAGYEISVGFKKDAGLSEEGKMTRSAEYLDGKGIKTVDDLRNKVIQVGTAIREHFDLLSQEGQKAFGKKGAGKDARNTND
ncbi:MAG: hypothetical protein SFW36_11395, partial [Leptolyngbyaceae cyanobacterium bins.59]|nr:hypothetical protein [Leptolyngbyaceae cyanobacterium bins.59]